MSRSSRRRSGRSGVPRVRCRRQWEAALRRAYWRASAAATCASSCFCFFSSPSRTLFTRAHSCLIALISSSLTRISIFCWLFSASSAVSASCAFAGSPLARMSDAVSVSAGAAATSLPWEEADAASCLSVPTCADIDQRLRQEKDVLAP